MKPVYDDEGRVKHYEMDGPFDFIAMWVMEIGTCLERIFGAASAPGANGANGPSPSETPPLTTSQHVEAGWLVERHYGGTRGRDPDAGHHPLHDSYDPDWGVSFESYCESQEKDD